MSAALRNDIDLTKARRNRGWSKAEAARKTEVGYATWCRAEGHLPISEPSAKAISDVFGFTVTEAFPEDPNVQSSRPLDNGSTKAVA